MYERQLPARIVYFEEFPMTDNKRKVSTHLLSIVDLIYHRAVEVVAPC